ncbi:MAG TPA: metalloregulator ArsR/SmtB family transcription factor [Nitriliruptorales bacterium]|nr:metalloregulator ArsR/SmtB family transcription factor [Nitriliruptorales bacterium]
MNADHDPVHAVFAALSSPTRRELLEDLARGGPATPSELEARHPVTRQAISKHLASMAEAGLVQPRRHGREVRYELTPAPMEEAASWLAAVGTRWDDRLQRLQRSLAEQGQAEDLPGSPAS